MSKNCTIKAMYSEDRPYEKCERFGAEQLTDAELLAVILRTGTKGTNSLELAGNILHNRTPERGILNLHHWSKEQLMKIEGVGRVKALQILCLSELAKRMARAPGNANLSFSSPTSIAEYYMEDMRHRQQEHMKLLMFNTKTKLLGETEVSKGTVNASLISPRELFIEALQKNAVSIILMHNHPSGDPSPSKEDILITKRIKSAGELIGIQLLDHIIIGDNCYISFAQAGLLSN